LEIGQLVDLIKTTNQLANGKTLTNKLSIDWPTVEQRKNIEQWWAGRLFKYQHY